MRKNVGGEEETPHTEDTDMGAGAGSGGGDADAGATANQEAGQAAVLEVLFGP